jgi:hypothetical protein
VDRCPLDIDRLEGCEVRGALYDRLLAGAVTGLGAGADCTGLDERDLLLVIDCGSGTPAGAAWDGCLLTRSADWRDGVRRDEVCSAGTGRGLAALCVRPD